jgi:uncharacterized SAM-binding protein YcdF (DUF218 family)
MLILQKVIGSFVELPGLCFILLFILAWILIKKGEKRLGWIVIALTGVIWFISTDIGLQIMVKPYEDSYSEVVWSEQKSGDAIIVVFSGGIVRNVPFGEDFYDQIGKHSMMRLYRAFEVYRETDSKIILTGGNVYDKEGATIAEVMRKVLLSWNVPERDILIENQAKTTYENAEYVCDMIPDDVNTVLLVTSAIHMPRSMMAFENVSMKTDRYFNLIPCPGDYQIETSEVGINNFLPNRGALSTFMSAFHEWVGNVFYLLK